MNFKFIYSYALELSSSRRRLKPFRYFLSVLDTNPNLFSMADPDLLLNSAKKIAEPCSF